MTTSGSYIFDPTFAAILDEAAERAGMDPSTLSARHIRSAKMSLNLMFSDWATRDGDAAYRVDRLTTSVTAGNAYFDPTSGVIDILDMVIEYNGGSTDTPMARISGQAYLEIPNKAETGQPAQYYVDHGTQNAPRVYLWPVPDATCDFTYECMRHTQIVRSLADTMDINRLWMDAVASGLALRLAEKYNQARVPQLQGAADATYRSSLRNSKGRSEVVISARGFGSSLRRRRS